MPAVPTNYEDQPTTNRQGLPSAGRQLASNAPAVKRMSTASARSCESLAEEEENELGDLRRSSLDVVRHRSASPNGLSRLQPEKRIRAKSGVRRSSMSPSASANASTGRPASMALPATSPLIASSSNNGRFSGIIHDDDDKPPTARIKPSVQAVRPSVKFNIMQPSGTRSILTAAAFNTAKRTARLAKKDRIANEILESEKVYVGVLTDVHEVGHHPAYF